MIDTRRRHRGHASIDRDGNPWVMTLVDPAVSPEDQVIRNDDTRRVRALLAHLPERQRTIVELRLAGLSGAEIAATLDLTPSAVKSAQFRAYGTLRTLFHHDDDQTSLPEAH